MRAKVAALSPVARKRNDRLAQSVPPLHRALARLGREAAAPVARGLATRGAYTGQENDPILAEWPECKIAPKPAQPQTIVAAVAGSSK